MYVHELGHGREHGHGHENEHEHGHGHEHQHDVKLGRRNADAGEKFSPASLLLPFVRDDSPAFRFRGQSHWISP